MTDNIGRAVLALLAAFASSVIGSTRNVSDGLSLAEKEVRRNLSDVHKAQRDRYTVLGLLQGEFFRDFNLP